MKVRLAIGGAIIAVLLGAATAGGARVPPTGKQLEPGCTWGASSVTAHFVDGHWVVEEPQTTGCTP
jgi:hypothetical protein